MNVIKKTIKELKILMVCLVILTVFSAIYVIAALHKQDSLVATGFFGAAVVSLVFCYFIHWVISVFKEIDIFIKKEIEEGRKEN